MAFRLTSICVHPSETQGQRLDALLGQLSAELGDVHIHTSLANRISHHGWKASDTGELDVSSRTGKEYDLLLLPVANEVEERVDDVDAAEHVCYHLHAVSMVLLSLKC